MDTVNVQELLGEKEWSVEDILGQGRYGVVVKARDVLADMHFAIKVVEYKSEDQIKYRKRELKLLAKCASQHKANVLQYLHWWMREVIDKQFLIIKMELCHRRLDVCLKEMSREETQADASTCISIVKDPNLYRVVFPQILSGLDAIHLSKPKWVHRDISLANILVQYPKPKSIREIQIKIGGFGLARELPTEAGVHLSNQAKLDAIREDSERTLYQAPELSGESYSEKVDMYSAGIVLYLLTSCRGNQNQWPSDVEIQALRDGKRGRSDLCHDDEVLAELLFSSTGNLLHKDPEKRPSAEQALRKLPLQRNIRIEDRDIEGEIFLQSAIRFLPKKFTPVNESLGKGSYSKVISVQHGTDGKHYAVKIISRADVPEKYQKRELDILTKQVDSPINHNNIVRYYDSWEEIVNGRPILYIQMELCNKSLRAILQEKPEIVDQKQLHTHVFKQLLLALIYIHGYGFVHRDVYPPNILISTRYEDFISSWVVKLADFGLARKIDQLSHPNSNQLEEKLSSSAGNRFYRAPEMWKGDYGEKIDIYSAGVVLYRLSCYLENDTKIENALSKLQKERMVDRNILIVGGDRLYALLNRLVKENPKERPDAREAEKIFSEYIRNENYFPPIDVLSLDEVSPTNQTPTQVEPTQPVKYRHGDNVSLDEIDGKSKGVTHVPAMQDVQLAEDDDDFDDDDFKDGLC